MDLLLRTSFLLDIICTKTVYVGNKAIVETCVIPEPFLTLLQFCSVPMGGRAASQDPCQLGGTGRIPEDRRNFDVSVLLAPNLVWAATY